MPDDDTAPEPPRSGPHPLVFWVIILLLAALVIAVYLWPQIQPIYIGTPNLNL